MGEQMKLEGQLRGHNGWVTQIAASPVYKNMLVSSSRDKTIILWQLDESGSVLTGKPLKSLHGHGHFVSDVVMSSDGQYALSGSWDKTLRLWDLNTSVYAFILAIGRSALGLTVEFDCRPQGKEFPGERGKVSP
ncbi:unnamed protein product [Meloidogyne enterolobii]|uniref:Uncharacterized protein n=1 Tax=Meloidogyne enterolobii TaxID=390850 RepID=A0ACB1AC77_MELEN